MQKDTILEKYTVSYSFSVAWQSDCKIWEYQCIGLFKAGESSNSFVR